MAISRMIDLHHGITDDGKLVKVYLPDEVEEIPLDEPTMLFRGRNKLSLSVIHYYLELCQEDNASEDDLITLNETLKTFLAYMDTELIKEPDIIMGEQIKDNNE